ncbi:MAG: DNA polymerase I [Synergistaceae bacterium]|nr:DNA polymerase I [Synergistaceae bacterium]
MKILIIDGHSLIHRAYHAMPDLNAPDGTKTGAVTGFFNMLFLAQDLLKPDVCAAAFDAHGKLARREVLPDYKANRARLGDDLKVQIDLAQEILNLIGVQVLKSPGVEADDIIGTLAVKEAAKNNDIIILSSDKDLMQLINSNIKMLRPITKGVSNAELYDEDLFKAEFKFEPELMADYLALIGDKADNIPGVKGIGGIGAANLISSFGSLENIFDNLDELKPAMRKKLLAAGLEHVLKIRALIKLDLNLDFDLDLNIEPDLNEAAALASRLGLRALLKRLNLNSNLSFNFKPEVKEVKARELDKDYLIILNNLDNELIALFNDREPEIFKPEFLNYNKIFTSDYTAILNKINFRQPDWDLRTAHYLVHPDLSFKTFKYLIEDILNQENKFEALLNLKAELDAKFSDYINLNKIMTELDLPLIPVLYKMERHGVKIKPENFRSVQSELENKISEIEDHIEFITGYKINLNSPRQVSDLLFNKLGLNLPNAKKKGGSFQSTAAEVLEQLIKLTDAQVPKLILEYRELSKILSAFVMPLQEHADDDFIVHTRFEPALTGTGRLSSQEPNLQNLPAFGDWAMKLKSGLVPVHDGNIFISADYSQIELRVLAHLSGEERLLEAFNDKRDIHAETASWVFDVAPEFVTPELRRMAKVINFGLLYGMNQFGLADRLGVSQAEAIDIMTKYFDALPGVKNYLDEITNQALAIGYAETLFGRVRPVNEINAKGQALKRVLINSPIQGTAADITRRAMLKLDEAINNKNINLFLQVHDSLVCECAPESIDEAGEILRKNMEEAAELSLSLNVNIKTGSSLAEV